MTVPIRMPTNNVATTRTVDKNRCDLMRSRNVMCESMIFPHQRLANQLIITRSSRQAGRWPQEGSFQNLSLLLLRREFCSNRRMHERNVISVGSRVMHLQSLAQAPIPATPT